MRFAIYASILIALIPLIFARPFFGLCLYYVVSLLQPKQFCWAPEFQDAMLVGLPLVMGAIVVGAWRVQHVGGGSLIPADAPKDRSTDASGAARPRYRAVRAPLVVPAWPLWICLALFLYITVARLLVATPIDNNTYQYRSLFKIMVVTALLTGMASEFRRLRILYIVIALSVGFWAIKGGLKVILLGPHQVYGLSYDNNLFALLSVMALPMVFYFGMSVRHARWRAFFIACSLLMCLAIIGSRSRAGFVALAFVLCGIAWTSRYRLRALAAVAVVTVTAFFVSGGEIKDRIESIRTFGQDRSARSRFVTWTAARDLLLENPAIGVGFSNFEYARERRDGGKKAAHNIYLQNLAELGLVGHPLWLTLIFGSVLGIAHFMRRARRLPRHMRWAYHWARGLFLGMSAFCIHGMFHNEEYLEFYFAMIGLCIALKVVTRREWEKWKSARSTAAAGARTRVPVFPVRPGKPPRIPADDLPSGARPDVVPTPCASQHTSPGLYAGALARRQLSARTMSW